MRGPSASDEAGNIYGIEMFSTYSCLCIRRANPRNVLIGNQPGILKMKVGRTNDMARRWGEHRRHCSLLQPRLLGYFPSNGETPADFDAGRVNSGGKKTPNSHLLERVVHKELADVAVNAPYLSPNGNSGGLGLGATQTRGACPSCEFFYADSNAY